MKSVIEEPEDREDNGAEAESTDPDDRSPVRQPELPLEGPSIDGDGTEAAEAGWRIKWMPAFIRQA